MPNRDPTGRALRRHRSGVDPSQRIVAVLRRRLRRRDAREGREGAAPKKRGESFDPLPPSFATRGRFSEAGGGVARRRAPTASRTTTKEAPEKRLRPPITRSAGRGRGGGGERPAPRPPARAHARGSAPPPSRSPLPRAVGSHRTEIARRRDAVGYWGGTIVCITVTGYGLWSSLGFAKRSLLFLAAAMYVHVWIVVSNSTYLLRVEQ